jgi:hypothetical protein
MSALVQGKQWGLSMDQMMAEIARQERQFGAEQSVRQGNLDVARQEEQRRGEAGAAEQMPIPVSQNLQPYVGGTKEVPANVLAALGPYLKNMQAAEQERTDQEQAFNILDSLTTPGVPQAPAMGNALQALARVAGGVLPLRGMVPAVTAMGEAAKQAGQATERQATPQEIIKVGALLGNRGLTQQGVLETLTGAQSPYREAQTEYTRARTVDIPAARALALSRLNASTDASKRAAATALIAQGVRLETEASQGGNASLLARAGELYQSAADLFVPSESAAPSATSQPAAGGGVPAATGTGTLSPLIPPPPNWLPIGTKPVRVSAGGTRAQLQAQRDTAAMARKDKGKPPVPGRTYGMDQARDDRKALDTYYVEGKWKDKKIGAVAARRAQGAYDRLKASGEDPAWPRPGSSKKPGTKGHITENEEQQLLARGRTPKEIDARYIVDRGLVGSIFGRKILGRG